MYVEERGRRGALIVGRLLKRQNSAPVITRDHQLTFGMFRLQFDNSPVDQKVYRKKE